MLPYMAQGAVQSIEDAAVLAKCLELGDARDPSAALQRTSRPASPAHPNARRARAATASADGEDQRKRDANLASATTAPLPQNLTWLYGHDVEAEFEQG